MHLQTIITEGEKVGQVDISGQFREPSKPANTSENLCSPLDCNSTRFIAKRSLLTLFIL